MIIKFDNQGSKSPPAGELNWDPYLPAYTGPIFQALDVDGPEYSAVDADIFGQFNELIFQYRVVFLLAGNPLRAVERFEHRIDRGDAPPIYSHSYKKSPAEVRAIKTEIERMLKLQIALPGQSELGSPCILVRKPLEKGQLQSPKFVVDYRRLNSVTKRSLPYPIHLKRTRCCKPRKIICKM